MSFDFLPDNLPPPPPPPKPSRGTDKHVKISNVYFYDTYRNYIDFRNIASIPPVSSEFKLLKNFEIYEDKFTSEFIKNKCKDDSWYGPNTTYEGLISGYNIFQNPKLIQETKQKVVNLLPENLMSSIPKKTIRFNDKGFGIFSFDKAASGMFLVYEYFDENDIKIDSNLVHKVKDKFYNLLTKKEVFQRKKLTENGLPAIKSNVKKSHIDFIKKEKERKSVEIYILISYAFYEDAKKTLYNCMAGVIIAEKLLEKGFLVKINGVLSGTDEFDINYHNHIVPAKNWNSTFDINAVAYVCGDPRFFRFEGFKGFIKGMDMVGDRAFSGVALMKNDVNVFASQIEDKYNPQTHNKIATTRLYFGGSRDINGTIKEVNKAVELLNKYYGNE